MPASPSLHQANLWAGRTVGLLGGSFNPAHEGHRHISLYALKHLGLDAVWWMVSPQNPLKSTQGMAPLEKRIKEAANVSRHPSIHVTDIELHLGTRYTSDTLTSLKTHFPGTRFIWLMGTDNLHQVHRWRNWQRIFNLVPVAVFSRPPESSGLRSCPALERFRAWLKPQEQAQLLKKLAPPVWTLLHNPLNTQSATEIREKEKLQH